MVKLNTKGEGLGLVFPQKYKEIIMEWLLSIAEPVSARAAWEYVNGKIAPDTVSRPSVINFMNWCVDEEMLEYKERTGKGGHHRVYWTDMGLSDFWDYVYSEVVAALAPHVSG